MQRPTAVSASISLAGITSHPFFASLWLALLVAIYLVATLPFLSSYPPVTGDEPWLADASYKLATQGTFGSDLFAGYGGMERRVLVPNPLFQLLLAGIFELFGAGVVQLRLLPVASGLAILLISYRIAELLADRRTALLSATFLVLLAVTTTRFGTGMPLLDLSRIARPDTLCAALSLFGYLQFEQGDRHSLKWRLLLGGFLFGLAATVHPIAFLWLPPIAVLLARRHGFRSGAGGRGLLLGIGFLLPSIPVILYLLPHWSAFIEQNARLSHRFGILDPRFYLQNLLAEYHRYGGLDLIDRSDRWIGGFGPWLLVISLPIATWIIIRRRRTKPLNDGMVSITLLLLIEAILLALVISQKTFTYTIGLIPLAATIVAWLGWHLWERWKGSAKRWLLVASLLAIIVEGSIRIALDHAKGRRADPYDGYTSRIAAIIPSSSVVVGPHHCWLGLRRFTFRPWLLPIFLSDSTATAHPIPFDSALEIIRPGTLLIDESMRGYLREISSPASPRHDQWIGYRRYLGRHRPRLLGVVRSGTYGTMEVWALIGDTTESR